MTAFWERHRQKKLERKELRTRNGGSWIKRMVQKTGVCLLSIFCFGWKLCLFGAAVPFLLTAVIALFCTGVVFVLQQQGYPLIGVTLFGLGGFLVAAGISGLFLSYVFAGKRVKEK